MYIQPVFFFTTLEIQSLDAISLFLLKIFQPLSPIPPYPHLQRGDSCCVKETCMYHIRCLQWNLFFKLHTCTSIWQLEFEVNKILYTTVHYYHLRPSLKCDEFSAKFYFSNVNSLFGYVSLLTNETLVVMS